MEEQTNCQGRDLTQGPLARQILLFGLRMADLRLSSARSRALLAIGIPSGMQNAIYSLANIFVQIGVNSFSATMVAGNSAATNTVSLVYDAVAVFYTACGSFIGQNYGAGHRSRGWKSYLISLGYSFGIGLLLGAALWVFGPRFLSLFTDDPAVVDAGLYRLNIMALSYPVSALMDCTVAASRGLGRSVVPTVFMLLGAGVFRIIWIATVFAHFRTIPSLYLLYVFSWLVAGALEIPYFIHVYRKETRGFTKN